MPGLKHRWVLASSPMCVWQRTGRGSLRALPTPEALLQVSELMGIPYRWPSLPKLFRNHHSQTGPGVKQAVYIPAWQLPHPGHWPEGLSEVLALASRQPRYLFGGEWKRLRLELPKSSSPNSATYSKVWLVNSQLRERWQWLNTKGWNTSTGNTALKQATWEMEGMETTC